MLDLRIGFFVLCWLFDDISSWPTDSLTSCLLVPHPLLRPRKGHQLNCFFSLTWTDSANTRRQITLWFRKNLPDRHSNPSNYTVLNLTGLKSFHPSNILETVAVFLLLILCCSRKKLHCLLIGKISKWDGKLVKGFI